MPAPFPRLRRVVAPALAALLALAPAACDLGGDPEPQLQQEWIAAEEAPPAAGTPPTVVVDAGAGIVSVTGEFVRTCLEGNVQLTHAFDGSALTIRAVATPSQRCTSTEPTRQFLRYFGYLVNVPAGTYQVRVVHENDDLAGATDVVHEETITVF